jgi:uncharacterized membrane protein
MSEQGKAVSEPFLDLSARQAVDRNRRLSPGAAFGWLGKGWRDLWTDPVPSIAYGLLVAALSLVIVGGLGALGWDYILFPALAGFLVVGPLLATGLYEKSRRLALGEKVGLGGMLRLRRGATSHLLFVGAILTMLMLLWLRAAVLIYALFFGLRPFPGLDHIAQMLFTTPLGLSMLAVGTLAGGLFAAFAFAISSFAIPMLLDRDVDAFTAMGLSISTVWQNLPVMLMWGVIVLVLTLIGIGTFMAGFILIFPLLGHASWHAYAAMRIES